jgi:hypothetical protein
MNQEFKLHRNPPTITLLVPFMNGTKEKLEALKATPIGTSYAQIRNVPFFVTHLGLDDIVEIDGDHVVRLVIKNTSTHVVKTFEPLTPPIFERVRRYFAKHGVVTEKAAPCCYNVSVPRGVTLERLMDLVETCPVKSELLVKTGGLNER